MVGLTLTPSHLNRAEPDRSSDIQKGPHPHDHHALTTIQTIGTGS